MRKIIPTDRGRAAVAALIDGAVVLVMFGTAQLLGHAAAYLPAPLYHVTIVVGWGWMLAAGLYALWAMGKPSDRGR